MMILVTIAAIVGAVLLTVVFGTLLWKVAHGRRTRGKDRREERDVDREFRKIARQIGRLDPPGED